MTTLHVRIWSHWCSKVWEGDVPISKSSAPLDPDPVNEYLFGLFNSTSLEYSATVDSFEYNLPSLSVGDRLTWNDETWQVDNLGFLHMTKPVVLPH